MCSGRRLCRWSRSRGTRLRTNRPARGSFAQVLQGRSAAAAGAAGKGRRGAVPSPIGTLTVEQYRGTYCDDIGATLLVATSGGQPNTAYSATVWVFAPGKPGNLENKTVTFTTDAAGNGSRVVYSTLTPAGTQIGTSTSTVSAGGTDVTVEYSIYCPGNQGG